MLRSKPFSSLVPTLLLATTFACATVDRTVVAGDHEAHFEHLKALAGRWSGTDAGGSPVAASYRVTAGGSAVVETIFEGSDHEMVTVYHRDGEDLVLTHYCAAGNQPSMRALPSDDPRRVAFECIGGRNMKEADGHMHQAVWIFEGDDRVRSEWTFHTAGKAEDPYVVQLTRAKSK